MASVTVGNSSVTDKSKQNDQLKAGDYCVLAAIVAFYFEGTLRKWVLKTDDPLFYPVAFSKELFLFAGIMLSTQERPIPSLSRFYQYLLGLPLLLSIAGCFIGACFDISLIGAAMTIRSLILLPIGACLLGRVSISRLIRPAIAIVSLSVLVNAPLAIVQFNSTRFDRINCYAGGSFAKVATTGFSDNVRATGTFSYISGLGFGAVVGVAAGIAVLATSNRFTQTCLGVVLIACSSIMALSTVSRGPVLACMLLLIFATFRFKRVFRFGLVAAVVMAAVLLFVETEVFTNRNVIGAVAYRSQHSDNGLERFLGPMKDVVPQVQETPLGAGLGMGQGISRRFGTKAVVETEFARVVYEIGIIGLAGFLMTYVGAVLLLFRIYRNATNRLLSGLVLGCAMLCLGLLYGGVAFNHISSLIFWGVFALGCIANDTLPVESPESRSLYRIAGGVPDKLPSGERWLPAGKPERRGSV